MTTAQLLLLTKAMRCGRKHQKQHTVFQYRFNCEPHSGSVLLKAQMKSLRHVMGLSLDILRTTTLTPAGSVQCCSDAGCGQRANKLETYNHRSHNAVQFGVKLLSK